MNRLAIDMLVGDTTRYLGIVAGVSLAVFLIAQQLAMLNGILDRISASVSQVSGVELWAMDPKVRYAEDDKPLPAAQLARVRSVAGVAWAVPLFKGNIRVRLADGTTHSASLTGLDDTSLIGGPAAMHTGSLADLRLTDGVILDEDSAHHRFAQLGLGGRRHPLSVGAVLELDNRRAVVAGISKSTRTFQSQPALFTTYSRAAQYLPPATRRLSFILIKCKPGENPLTVASRISQLTGLQVQTTAAFAALTREYFIAETGIIGTFLVGIGISFFVGTVIAGQTLYNFTIENLRQFGAIKAMGATNWTVLGMILCQAGAVGLLGLGIGGGAAAVFAWLMRDTEMNLRFSAAQLGLTALAVTAITLLAAGLASRKVLRFDAAEVFKT